jgi:hypothetical protein
VLILCLFVVLLFSRTIERYISSFTFIFRQLTSIHFLKTFSKESPSREIASFVPPSHVPSPVKRQSSSTSSPPSPTRPGLSASIHAPSPQRKGLSASIYASSSPSEEDICDSILVPSYPDSSASIYAPSSPPRPDRGASIPNHAPCTPPKRGLNASIHAPPSQHEPMEPKPIPVVDLSPEHRTRRVIDPQRKCDLLLAVAHVKGRQKQCYG